MEYGEAITSRAAEKALLIARRLLPNRQGELRAVAADAIHANLIDEIELRLREHLDEGD